MCLNVRMCDWVMGFDIPVGLTGSMIYSPTRKRGILLAGVDLRNSVKSENFKSFTYLFFFFGKFLHICFCCCNFLKFPPSQTF